MPRKKKAIPSALEGRASLAAEFERLSQETQAFASALRKPYSLIKDSGEPGNDLCQTIRDLFDASQCLSDLAVDVSLGRVAVAQADVPREDPQRMLFDGIAGPSEN